MITMRRIAAVFALLLGAAAPGRAALVLTYCGYFGGSVTESARDVAVDVAGNAYFAGQADSNNLPVVIGPDRSFNNKSDGFVAKVSLDGSSLVYAGYLGGGENDWIEGVAVDAA